MAWPVTRLDTFKPNSNAWNEIVNALSTWGGDSNAGGYNLAGLRRLTITGTGASGDNLGLVTGTVVYQTSAPNVGVLISPTEVAAAGARFQVLKVTPILNGTFTEGNVDWLRLTPPTLTGTTSITNAHGLYIDALDITGVGTAYGVYQAGTADLNYLAGNTGLGTSAPGSNKLAVSGNAAITGTLAVTGAVTATLDSGIGTTAGAVAATAGRIYLTIKGSTGSGAVELITATADADLATVGIFQFSDQNSTATDKRAAFMRCILSGSTANKRGGLFDFWTRADNADTSPAARLIIQSNGGIIFNTMPTATDDSALVNGALRWYAQSNTSLRVRYKGSDGTVREGTITLS